MSTDNKYTQLYLRVALGIGFIVPVLDRLGMVGAPGQPNISWGTWDNFIGFTGVLMPYLSKPLVLGAGFFATLLEAIFGICLIIGYKTRLMALGSFALTLIFGLSMVAFLGYKAPLNFSVFPCSAGSLLLATLTNFDFSIDQYLNKKSISDLRTFNK